MNAHDAQPDPETGPAGQPDEAQLRAAYEAELSRITSVDMALQAAASLLNIGAHRLGLTGGDPPQRAAADRHGDLEQVRDAIDAVRGLLPVIERRAADELRPLRDALAQLQMAYSRAIHSLSEPAEPQGQDTAAAAPGSAPAQEGKAGQAQPGEVGKEQPGAGKEQSGGPGPAESSGRLWVPGR
jgi:hypothetical protein